jgi:hypothetical protein
MSLANKFLAQMRAATRSLMRRGPSVARSVIRESVKNATAMQSAAFKSAQQAAQQAAQEAARTASNQESYDPASDMLADLSRQGQAGGNPFHVPPLSSGAGGGPAGPVHQRQLRQRGRHARLQAVCAGPAATRGRAATGRAARGRAAQGGAAAGDAARLHPESGRFRARHAA